jgi:hypothetical protein
MAITHYRYLVLKMSFPNCVLKIYGACDEGISTLEKLQDLTASHEAAAGLEGLDPTPLTSHHHSSASAPHVQPSDNEGVLVKTIQIGVDAAETTHIVGGLDSK